ncbi:MAG: hypothetical protein WC376_01680 [Candidatus Nanoarchaeia archaeon]|jgi:hypothetical protein
MAQKIELLELINRCSSIAEYKANTSMLLSIAYEYLGLDENHYLAFCKGKRVSNKDEIKKNDKIMIFYTFEKVLEKII